VSFGRKGLAPGERALPPGPAGFGRQREGQDEVAARRAAFLAEERARGQAPQSLPVDDAPAFSPSPANTARREKSMSAAYILWFFLGGLSAHRFYLGFTTSAIIQALLAPMAYMMMLGASLGLGLVCLIVAWIWIISDVFTIPGMLRQANERVSRLSVQTVFA